MVAHPPGTPKAFDRGIFRRRRHRFLDHLPQADFLHRRVNGVLLDRLADIRRSFETGVFTGDIPLDSSPAHRFFHTNLINSPGVDAQIDEEWWPFAPQSLDLIISSLSLHNTNDLPGALVQMRRSLKPDGLFLAAMAGGETLHELRYALQQAEIELKGGISPRVHPFADKPQAGALLQRTGYALPVVDSDPVTVTYSDLRQLMKDLRAMGAGNVSAERSRALTGKNLFDKAEDIYRAQFADQDGRIPATFEIIYLIGWAPHDSQQKPLRPGSANQRLAEALGTDEIKTGEKPQ